MYVKDIGVKVMSKKTLEKTDNSIGLEFEVKKNTPNANRIGFSNTIFTVGEKVYVLSNTEREDLMKQLNQVDEYKSRIEELEAIDTEDLQGQLQEKDAIISNLNARIDVLEKEADDDSEIAELQEQLHKTNLLHKEEIADFKKQIHKQETVIKELELSFGFNEDQIIKFKHAVEEKDSTIADLKQMNDNLAKENDELKNKAEGLVDASEVEELQNEIAELKEQLEGHEGQLKYWKNAYENLIESSDELAARNETLIKDNNQLKDANNKINETNKLLNQNLMGINDNYKETTHELQSVFDDKESELKETIKKQQIHIDELTEKVESLVGLRDYIPPKEHYEALEELRHKIKDVERELDKAKAEVDMRLATQKSEIDIKHTEEKAQMLLAYNQELNNHKLKYNELAKDYNHLLGDASSLSRINTLFSGRHKTIVKDKEPVELEEIEVEKEPPTETIEYVPKDEIHLI